MSYIDRNPPDPRRAIKEPVRLATTAAITLSGLQSIDGIATAENDRVLVKDQASTAENGIYYARTGAWERSPEWGTSSRRYNVTVAKGTQIFVTDGSTHAGTVWYVATATATNSTTITSTFARLIAPDLAGRVDALETTVGGLGDEFDSDSAGLAPASGGGTDNFLRADGTWAEPPGGAAGRELLTGNRSYYVRTDGSDSNDGLANTSGGAFLTIQKAVNVAVALDLGAYSVTINVADGTYTGAVTLKPYIGTGPISIVGNTTTPANVAISVTSADCFSAVQTAAYTLSGMKLSAATSGMGLRARSGSPITLTHVHFGECVTAHIWAESNASISITTGYTIAGSAGRHWIAYRGGQIFGPGAVTVTLTGTPAFSTAFADAQLGGGMEVNGITFSGSATGARYSATMNGFINTIGGGASYLPGNSSGSTATGGQYA